MPILDYIERIKRIDQLIRLRATGTPKELAQKLGLSRSTVYEYINIMKEINAPIEYDDASQNFIYTEEVKFKVEFARIEY